MASKKYKIALKDIVDLNRPDAEKILRKEASPSPRLFVRRALQELVYAGGREHEKAPLFEGAIVKELEAYLAR